MGSGDHPNGISNIADVYWKIYHPDGSFKVQVHGNKVPVKHCDDLGNVKDSYVGSMFYAAYQTGQVAPEGIVDVNRGMFSLCHQEIKSLWYTHFDLSKDQMCGKYKVEATAVAQVGATTKLVNYIDIHCVFTLTVDFDKVDWGNVTPGLSKVLGGDLEFDTHNAPTVKNIGNTGMGLKIKFSEMVGESEIKIIDKFDAKFGCDPAHLKNIPVIKANEWVDFGTGSYQVLCANELGKLDLSVHPPSVLPADNYSGKFWVAGFHVEDECKANKHGED